MTSESGGQAGAEEGSAERGYGPLPFYHRLRHTGYLRHLLVRKAAFTGEILVDLITTTQMAPDLTGFCAALLDREKQGRLLLHWAGGWRASVRDRRRKRQGRPRRDWAGANREAVQDLRCARRLRRDSFHP